jgi:hypothetical protein
MSAKSGTEITVDGRCVDLIVGLLVENAVLSEYRLNSISCVHFWRRAWDSNPRRP